MPDPEPENPGQEVPVDPEPENPGQEVPETFSAKKKTTKRTGSKA